MSDIWNTTNISATMASTTYTVGASNGWSTITTNPDIKGNTLTVKGEIKKLSHREATLLQMLCDSQNTPLDRKDILMKIWGDDSFFNSRNLDVYVTKLREYLKADPDVEIITIKGHGYLFSVKN